MKIPIMEDYGAIRDRARAIREAAPQQEPPDAPKDPLAPVREEVERLYGTPSWRILAEEAEKGVPPYAVLRKVTAADPESVRKRYKVVRTDTLADIPGEVMEADEATGVAVVKDRTGTAKKYELGPGGIRLLILVLFCDRAPGRAIGLAGYGISACAGALMWPALSMTKR